MYPCCCDLYLDDKGSPPTACSERLLRINHVHANRPKFDAYRPSVGTLKTLCAIKVKCRGVHTGGRRKDTCVHGLSRRSLSAKASANWGWAEKKKWRYIRITKAENNQHGSPVRPWLWLWLPLTTNPAHPRRQTDCDRSYATGQKRYLFFVQVPNLERGLQTPP